VRKSEIELWRKKLHLLDAGCQYVWIRWIDERQIEVLGASGSASGLLEKQVYALQDIVPADEVDAMAKHYAQVNNQISILNFSLRSEKERFRKFICSSQKFDSQIESVWVLQETNHQQSTDLLLAAAHDLRSPVNSILSLANLLQMMTKEGDFDKKQLKDMVKMIKTSCNQAIDFTSDLLELSEIESTKYELDTSTVEMNTFLRQYISTHRLLLIKKKIKVRFHSSSKETCELKINKSKFTRILDNLMSNAVKFCEVYGKIDLYLDANKKETIIRLKDDGVGMSEEVQTHLFEKFGKSKRLGLQGEKSHGLGLSIVKQIMELHGASVAVESQEGQGTGISLVFKN